MEKIVIFNIVENLLNSNIGLFVIGMLLVVFPCIGIMVVHKKKF